MTTTQIIGRLWLLPAVALLASCSGKGDARIAAMRCEWQPSPVGIDALQPRFTWNWASPDKACNFAQERYRIDVASSKAALGAPGAEGDVWSSSEYRSGNGYCRYTGTETLRSHAVYYWRVTAWGEANNPLVSPVDSFEMAKMAPSDWSARWISDGHDKDFNPSPMLRKRFVAKEGVRRARLYVSAAAYYKMTLNGEEVTRNRLDPGYTHYDKRNLYATHDVTGLLRPGENVLASVLGNGFYNEIAPVATWDFEKARWRNRPRMIAELRIEYNDGTEQVVATDGTWRTATGPYVQDNIYSGDTYDARLDMPGWNRPGFDDTKWTAALEVPAPSPLLVAQAAPAIQVAEEMAPVAMRSFGDTVYVFDFGVNLTGVCKLSVQGEAGTKITLQHGELLKDNGRIEMRNLDIYYKPLPGLAFQTDTYILSGRKDENLPPPAFTYHGFQYVEVKSDRPVKLTKESLTAQFLHTAVEPVGEFRCSNELLNKIWKAARQSYLSNLMSIPTDCPQREKNGWTADAHVAIDLGLLNYDGIRFYEKWLDDFVDNQRADGRISGIIPSAGWGYEDWIGPVWDAAAFILPEAIFNYYGDTASIVKMYPVCEKYLADLSSREDADGCVTYGIGDWVPYHTKTPTEYTSSCYYYLDNKLMAEFAALTGRDGSAYARKAQELRQTINRKYYNPATGLYANGSQAAQGVALYLGLVPEGQEQKVADHLYKLVEKTGFHLDFGMLGSKTVLRMLSRYGYADAAYKMAAQETAPSWGAWIKQGFTTLAETWVLSPEFRDASVNHVFLGDVSAWMTNVLAGINFDEAAPGFRHIVLRPHFVKGLDWVKASYRSPAGLIRSAWERRGDRVILRVSVPANTTATLHAGGKERVLGAGTHELKF